MSIYNQIAPVNLIKELPWEYMGDVKHNKNILLILYNGLNDFYILKYLKIENPMLSSLTAISARFLLFYTIKDLVRTQHSKICHPDVSQAT